MIKDLVSVIIPCYNVAPFLRRCLDSVLNNTYRNLEVICINDGSTDDTLEILNSYTDERIVVFSHENKGLSESRNVGIEKAHGEFVCFIDSDDWIHKRFFEHLIDVQRKSQADIVVCKYLSTYEFCEDAEIEDVNYTIGSYFKSYDSSMLYDAAWNKLYKKEIVEDARFVSVFAEDQLFNTSLFIKHKNALCAIVDATMYYYFQRPGSLMHVFHEDRMLALAKGYLEVCDKAVDDTEVYNYLVTRGFKLGLSTRYKTMFRDNFKEYRKSCDVFLNEAMKKMKGLTLSTRILYFMFVKFPFLYRRYRIMMDPTMKDWENKEIALQKTK